MKTTRKVGAAAAGLLAACLTAVTASAQTYLAYEYGNSAGGVSEVSVADLKPNWVVTGVRNGGNKEELIVWESTGTSLLRKGSATGPVSGSGHMATVALSSSRVITAAPTSNGSVVQLTSWSVSPTGTVTLGSSMVSSLTVGAISMAKLDSSHVVVAFANLGGGLQLDLYEVSSNGTITYEATQVLIMAALNTSITHVNSSQVVTAISNDVGDLQLDSWKVNLDVLFGPIGITHQDTATAGGNQGLSITAWADEGHVATAILNSGSRLEVIDWAVNPSTGVITRKSSSTVGEQGNNVAVSTIGNEVFAAGQNFNGVVEASVWGYDNSSLAELASQKQEAVGQVSAAPLNTGNSSVTASITWSGDLQVDVWYSYSIQ